MLVIDIVKEGIERFYPLANTAVKPLPLSGGNNARHAVKRDQSFGTLILTVDVKGDANSVKEQLRLLLFLPDRELIGTAKPLPPGVIVLTLLSLCGKHLIIIMPVRKRYFYHGRLLRLYSL